MSNARKPAARKATLPRKVTPADRKKQQERMNDGLSVNVDGTTYTVRMGDLTSSDTAGLRRATGFSFMGLCRAAHSDPDIDVVAALVWLSRRIDGERQLDYETVADEIGYDADISMAETPDDPEDDDRPEA